LDTFFSGFQFLGVILVTAIPFWYLRPGLEAIDNVAKRGGRGRQLPDHAVLTADGVVSLIGCMMGILLSTRLYRTPGLEGHGGRIGYSAERASW